MNLELTPKWLTDESMVGELAVNGEFECYTLERPWNNGDNRHEVSAILPGRYRVVFSHSPHFGKDMMHLVDVPGRDHIMIHNANQASELLGCIAVGQSHAQNWVGASKQALANLTAKVQAAIQGGEQVYITVKRPQGESNA